VANRRTTSVASKANYKGAQRSPHNNKSRVSWENMLPYSIVMIMSDDCWLWMVINVNDDGNDDCEWWWLNCAGGYAPEIRRRRLKFAPGFD
jgi:hypothetical protein